MAKSEERRGKTRQDPIYIKSVAQGFLVGLLQQEQLRAFAIQHGINYLYLYQIAVGERNPSRSYINALKNVIPPKDWYQESAAGGDDSQEAEE